VLIIWGRNVNGIEGENVIEILA